MRESEKDLEELQSLLDQSVEQAGSFLREAMQLDRNSLSARQLVRHLSGMHTVSLASVTARGEPRVAPISAIFVRGHYYIPTVKSAARAKHLSARPGVSLSEYNGGQNAVTIHGQATMLDISHPDFEGIDELFVSLTTEDGPRNWGGDGPLYIRVDPDVMYATALDPDHYPE